MPEMTPDINGNIEELSVGYAPSIDSKIKIINDRINDKIDKIIFPINIEEELCKNIIESKEFTWNFKLKSCHCALCRNHFEKVGFKKAIKWNSKMYNKYKKNLKRLKDKSIRSGLLDSENELEKQYAIAQEMMMYHLYLCRELRMLRNHHAII